MEVRTSRAKAGAAAVACAALVAVFAWAARTNGAAWVGVGLFALGVLAAGKQVLRPTTVLRLDDDALVVVGGIRPRPPIPWSHVQRVEVRQGSRLRGSHVAVGINDGSKTPRWLEFGDTWLNTDADALGEAIAARASSIGP
jgi:hypothetical protein